MDDKSIFTPISEKDDQSVGVFKRVGMLLALAVDVGGHHFTTVLGHLMILPLRGSA